MRLHSTAAAQLAFASGPALTAPKLLSGLTGAQVRIYFERFGHFVFQRAAAVAAKAGVPLKSSDGLAAALYNKFISQLLIFTGNSTAPAPGSNMKPGESLAAAVARRYDELRANSLADAYDFQLYLYIALHHFEVWYCVDVGQKIDTKHHALSTPIRTYLRRYLVERHKTRLEGRWSPGFRFDECFVVERPLYVSEESATSLTSLFNIEFKPFGFTQSEIYGLVKEFRDTLAAVVLEDIRRIVNTLTLASGTQVLIDGFGDFYQCGLGDGTETKGMFGDDNYGLLFFDYTQQDTWQERFVQGTPTYLAPTLIKHVLSDVDGPDAGLCFLYYGLNSDYPKPGFPLDKGPSLELTAYDVPLLGITTRVGHAQRINGCHFSGDMTYVTLASFGASLLDAAMKTNGEEVVFIIFKHRMGPRPETPGFTPQHVSLDAELRYDDNRFAKTPSEAVAEAFPNPSAALTNATALAQTLADHPVFEIDHYSVGLGVGVLEGLGKPGPDVRRASIDAQRVNQAQSSLTTSDGTVRYSYGTANYYSETGVPWLVLTGVGFCSPLRCTWKKHIAAAQYSGLVSDFGAYVPEDYKEDPDWNIVLSAFRAFGMIEALIEGLKFAAFTLAGDTISFGQEKTLKDKLDDYLKNDAFARIMLPSGLYPETKSGEEIVVRYKAFHKYTVQ